ncbi:MAG: hypothetical protein JW800_03120 [Candidatus Omnitrophica bacterium]|nr:hypothetical protein [Candidatus Omnitrophota bacterium]
MEAIWGLICGLFILLGFEMRIRLMQDDIVDFKIKIDKLTEDIATLEEKIRTKRNALERI